MKQFFYGAFLTLSLIATVKAAELNVSLQIPALNVAEYHRPYVAVWLENDNQQFVANLSVCLTPKNVITVAPNGLKIYVNCGGKVDVS